MNKFPSNIEKDFLSFLYDYHFLSYKDAQYLFKSKLYYKKQILDLINDDYIKKHKSGSYILSNAGKRYLKSLGYDFSTKMAYSNEYIQRQKLISFIAAFYYFSNNVEFIPSFKHKDKDIFTIKSRRYIGLLKINNIEYLTYYISKKQNLKYVNSVYFDIQKEKKYKNIIIFAEDINMINISQFCFGLNRVLIVDTNEKTLENLNYLNKIDWTYIIKQKYGANMYLSEYNFCDYTNRKSKYVACFYYIDTEKINLIKYFIKENKEKKVDIIGPCDILNKLKQEIPNQNYIELDINSNMIKKEFNIFE